MTNLSNTGSSSRANDAMHPPPTETDVQAFNVIREVIKNRKQRLTKFRDMGKDLLEEDPRKCCLERGGRNFDVSYLFPTH